MFHVTLFSSEEQLWVYCIGIPVLAGVPLVCQLMDTRHNANINY